MSRIKVTRRIHGFCLFLLLALGPGIVHAQIDDEYFMADRLLQQQKFEEAYEQFYRLYQQHPGTFIFLDKATECLVNLKQYDKAIALTKQAVEQGRVSAEGKILLGEIYHISGDTTRAQDLWREVIRDHPQSQQVYLTVARAMKDRRNYQRAIEVFREARSRFSNSSLLTSDLAETYLQAGRYEESIEEYLQLIKDFPDRMDLVQRRLIRFRNDDIYDVAILEISDFLEQLSPDHPSYQNLQQLEIWLLMERKLFRRALTTAKNYEAQSSHPTYTLYSLGARLLAEQQFELAEQAYSFYIENDIQPTKFRCMEELAEVYMEWAAHLENYNLGLSSKRDSLYQKAYTTLESLHRSSPSYGRLDQVLIAMSELSLDIFHQPGQARDHLSELRSFSDDGLTAQVAYIEGRLHLYNREYTQARIAFTKSNKQEHIGELAEKTRYYLALSDFYAGDYEFAKIQLNALERQKTSYFANDAVQLRLWIQEGIQADSTGKLLKPFARAMEFFSQGKNRRGITALKKVLRPESYNPLADEALLELSSNKEAHSVLFVYRTLSGFLTIRGKSSPLYERLLWEKARIADQLVTSRIPMPTVDSARASQNNAETSKSAISIPTNIAQLIPLYEEVLLNFPNGFYASYARDRIQELQKIQT